MSAGIRAAPRRRLSRPITLHTADGSTLDADMWVRAVGVRPHSEYLPLRVAGETSIFATGDPGDADRDMAGIASRQAELTAANIHALITGSGELAAWETFPPLIVIPGARGRVRLPRERRPTPATIAQIKGRDMLIDNHATLFDATPEEVCVGG